MKIGLGTAAIGRPQYINIREHKSDKPFDSKQFIEDGKQLLIAAYKQGIRHFDTAPGYGIAEQIMLEWISEQQPQDITISTKWGYTYTANFDPNAEIHEVKEHSINKLNEQWDQSSQLLPFLNLYQIHSATLDSGVLENQEVLERLAELKELHQIEIGLSVSGANQNEIIEKALAVTTQGKELFDSVQVTYNIFEQSLSQIAHLLKDKKIIIKEALANGRVFPNADYSNYQEAYELLKNLALKYGTGIDAIALRFCIDTTVPYFVLSGPALTEHLDSNLKAIDFQLSNDDLELLKTLVVDPYDYWNERKRLNWN